METFVVTQGERHPTDLAGLRGARLVTAIETERCRRWAESKINALTGGDRVSARFMRHDFFEYTPAFKLVIAGNHKPGLTGVNDAIRRRFHLVPFTVTIAEPDKELPEKLRPERPGILAWMIEGCRSWLENGLNPPDPVKVATATYLAEEDSLAQWIDECCVTGRDQWGVGAQLWQSWKAWAESIKEQPGTRKAFADAMAAHGHTKDKRRGVPFRASCTRERRSKRGNPSNPSKEPRRATASAWSVGEVPGAADERGPDCSECGGCWVCGVVSLTSPLSRARMQARAGGGWWLRLDRPHKPHKLHMLDVDMPDVDMPDVAISYA
jgi:phage/plasmid-associated DNA primase